MALSVSSFPDRIQLPPQDTSAPSATEQQKGRKILRNPFGKNVTPIFSRIRPRRQQSTPVTTIEKSVQPRADPTVLVIPAQLPRPPSPEVLDLTNPSPIQRDNMSVTIFSSGSSTSESPASRDEVLIFPPTPTLPPTESPNHMKESIKALGRLSRFQRPIDWARKDDHSLPPWAIRNVVDSFGGDPLAFANSDRDRDRDRSVPETPVSTNSSYTPSSTGATHGRRPSAGSLATAASADPAIGRRPSAVSLGTTPESRASSVYWSSATSAISTSTSPQVPMPTKSVTYSRTRTTSDPASVKAPSEKSMKTSASSSSPAPTQLTGANAMRLRAASTTSSSSEKDKARKSLGRKPSLTIIPPTAELMREHQQRKRAQSLSSAVSEPERTKEKSKEDKVPTSRVPSTAGSTRSKSGRQRTTSTSSQAGSLKQRSRGRTIPAPLPSDSKLSAITSGSTSSLPSSLPKASLSAVDLRAPRTPFSARASRANSPARTASHSSTTFAHSLPLVPLPTASSFSSGLASASVSKLSVVIPPPPPLPPNINSRGMGSSSQHKQGAMPSIPPPPPLLPHEIRRKGSRPHMVPPPPPLPLNVPHRKVSETHLRDRSHSTSTQPSPVVQKPVLGTSSSLPVVPSLKSMASVPPPSLPPLISTLKNQAVHNSNNSPASARPSRSLPIPPVPAVPLNLDGIIDSGEQTGTIAGVPHAGVSTNPRISSASSAVLSPATRSNSSASVRGIALGSPGDVPSSASVVSEIRHRYQS